MKKEKLLKNKAVITINGKYCTEAGTDTVELTTYGTYTKVDGKYYITYREQDEGMVDVVTTLTWDGAGRVTLTRAGDVTSRLILEKGKRHTCSYEMGGMQLMMGVFSDILSSDLDESGGTLALSYTLDINSSLISRNEIEITVKEAEG
ncbi:MAG: DUF1934 domain-containing protein [Clostridia bacterium]|nr:DUF1934 domain-containing protein [Clostridia bacterium]